MMVANSDSRAGSAKQLVVDWPTAEEMACVRPITIGRSLGRKGRFIVDLSIQMNYEIFGKMQCQPLRLQSNAQWNRQVNTRDL
mmetsp:Transcript_33225/g.56487  ORF Transcript_33225/g.56487 Transcript_33225/m.56487 type:complete len:83 (-) Transcript_33225:384-632(-)